MVFRQGLLSWAFSELAQSTDFGKKVFFGKILSRGESSKTIERGMYSNCREGNVFKLSRGETPLTIV